MSDIHDPPVLSAKHQIDGLIQWLRRHSPGDVMAPVAPGGKAPLVKHAHPIEWTCTNLARWRAKHPDHVDFAILLKALCVVDVDNIAVAAELESRFPVLKVVPHERTLLLYTTSSCDPASRIRTDTTTRGLP